MKFCAVFKEQPSDGDLTISNWSDMYHICSKRKDALKVALDCIELKRDAGEVDPSAYVVELKFTEPDVGDLIVCAFNQNSWPNARAIMGRIDRISLKNILS